MLRVVLTIAGETGKRNAWPMKVEVNLYMSALQLRIACDTFQSVDLQFTVNQSAALCKTAKHRFIEFCNLYASLAGKSTC